MARYTTTGALDATFDGDGKMTTSLGNGDDEAQCVALQPDGKIVCTGYTNSGDTDNMAVVRLNPDGSLDATFDSDGKTVLAPGLGNDRLYGVAFAPDGNIVAAGYSTNTGGVAQFAVVRLLGGPNAPAW